MLKIFLVEDDIVAREEIKNKINWEAQGYELCGEAGDGELAFPLIRKLRPDIVITDIKMPFMDGLVLSRLIKQEMPFTEVIVLTEDRDFEYARECVRLGVARYLLKPVGGSELLREIDSLAKQIAEKNREHEDRVKYLKDKKELFRHLVTGSNTPAQLLESARSLELDLSAVWYNILLIKIHDPGRTYDEHSEIIAEIEEQLEQRFSERVGQVLVFDRDLEGKALLFKADSREELTDIQSNFIAKLKEMLTLYGQVNYFGGFGTPVNRLGELPGSFEKASRAFARRYLEEGNRILDSGESEQENLAKQDEFDIGSISPKQVDRRKIQEFLKVGSREDISHFIEEYFRGLWDDNAMKSNIFRHYIILDAYFCVADFLEELQIPRSEIIPPDMSSGALQRVEDASAYVTGIVSKALELREKAASNRYRDTVHQVMQYIEENYADEELSLNLLAAYVNFSPNHLSMVFSQQTGQTLSKYLTDIRMNKAKELLCCTGKKSSVISVEVGYKDPHYFSYLFKKTQGMTPTQFRNSQNAKMDKPSK